MKGMPETKRQVSEHAPAQDVENDRTPARLVRIEAEALLALAARLEGAMAAAFERAVSLVVECGETRRGRVVVTGMGKSGIIAQKIAATLSSTGSPALFLHPAEAVHGDIGMIAPGDLVLALSASGETEEILRLLAMLRRGRDGIADDGLICFTCCMDSTLARASDVALDCSVAEEACGLGLAPTASTTAMLALGDALAIAVSMRKGFREEDFANLHPGGKLGKQLAAVRSLMHAGEAVPRVRLTTPMADVIYEMSRKGLGMTVVEDDAGALAGVLSDGDLRRLLEREGPAALARTAGESMHRGASTIGPEELAVRALAILEQNKITSLVVVESLGEGEGGPARAVGVVHLHDLWGTELV
jgi:arabinose-5-phosphate isomerase